MEKKLYPQMNEAKIQNSKFKIQEKSASIRICLWTISLIFALAPVHQTAAQVRSVYDNGAVGFGQILKKLNTTKSVMHIGAHPDDEDSGLLAYLARGENARTAYLSLTRGDGGQNIIGSELFESLGVIRTEELLQARRLDGAAAITKALIRQATNSRRRMAESPVSGARFRAPQS